MNTDVSQLCYTFFVENDRKLCNIQFHTEAMTALTYFNKKELSINHARKIDGVEMRTMKRNQNKKMKI